MQMKIFHEFNLIYIIAENSFLVQLKLLQCWENMICGYCEVHTLLEHLLNVFYRCSDNSHSDMQIYDARKLFEKMNSEKAE